MPMQPDAFWQGRAVLVTGADGFIGSHLAERLVSLGAQVRALVQYNSFNSWGWLDDSPARDRIEAIAGDVRDPLCCREICRGVDTVFHLAALIAIPYSYRAPQSYVETNVSGTLNMAQAAKEAGVRRFMHTSTSEVYGTAQYVPIDERHPLQPQSPYSASKIGADQMALSYWHAFELPVTIMRPFNTYGPRQSARAVIPAIIVQIASGARTIRLGDVSPTRDFNYVADTCDAMLALAQSEKTVGEVVNIATNREISIADTLKLIQDIMAWRGTFVQDAERMRPAGSEVFRLWGDNRKIERLIGWKPRVSFEEGLRRTVEWFVRPDNLRRYKGELYNV